MKAALDAGKALDALEQHAMAVDHVRKGGDCDTCPAEVACDEHGDADDGLWVLCGGTAASLIAQHLRNALAEAAR